MKLGPYETNRAYFGDALDLAQKLPDESIQCIVTSPPYWGLRDYGTEGQLGLEATPEEYVNKLVAILRELRRALRKDGTLWLNLGDCYYTAQGSCHNPGGGPCSRVSYGKHLKAAGAVPVGRNQPNRVLSIPRARELGLKPKDLVGIPWSVAFALRADGWWLRSDIVWSKPNPFPESVTDRPTKSHEYIFLLMKAERYYYDGDAIREDLASDPKSWGRHSKKDPGLQAPNPRAMFGPSRGGRDGTEWGNKETRNKRSVWTVATQPYSGPHFSTFPPDLIKPCILAGCPEGGIVLDPFIGSGTTGQVCQDLDRRWLGFDIDPDNEKLILERTKQQGLFAGQKK